MSSCLLCLSSDLIPLARAHGRDYFQCTNCKLIFVPRVFHPDRKTERRHYETHNNDPADERYRSFLRRLEQPLLKHLKPSTCGLDYGAGPGPALASMLKEKGFEVATYDPFFAPETDVLKRTYDFITCTEAVEHFHAPRAEFDRLYGLLNPAGWLAVMTQWADRKEVRHWRYARDVTHVCLYRSETMKWIADHYGYGLEMPRRNVALLHKQ